MKKSKLPVMLLALLCATMVWLYDVTVVNPTDAETFSNIPVVFENEEEMRMNDLMVTNGTTETVTLRISGRRSELKKLSRNNIQVSVNLGEITEAGVHELSYTVRFPTGVSAGDLTIETRSPATVSVEAEHYIQRNIEVHAVFEGDASHTTDGGSLVLDTDAMQIEPSEISVTGPADIVDTITYARIVINKADITQTTVADYDFVLLDGNAEEVSRDELVTDCDTVRVSIPVLKYKEVPLILKTQPGGGATDENISYTMSASTIKISGEAQSVDRISQIELGTLDYAAITGPTTRTYPIILPDGINNASGVAEVTVSVKVSGLNVVTMSISDFTLTNIPANLSAESISESVQLTLRGTPAALSSLSEDDVEVTVDLSGFTQAGTYIVPVSVKVPDGLQIGTIGSNTVTVTIS